MSGNAKTKLTPAEILEEKDDASGFRKKLQ
jgi:hypothetical protein